MYVNEICAEGIFVTFIPLVTNMWKVGQKYFFFSNERHFKFDFQKRKQLRFPEVNYLNYTKMTQFCM